MEANWASRNLNVLICPGIPRSGTDTTLGAFCFQTHVNRPTDQAISAVFERRPVELSPRPDDCMAYMYRAVSMAVMARAWSEPRQ